jgi:hypothetical protein
MALLGLVSVAGCGGALLQALAINSCNRHMSAWLRRTVASVRILARRAVATNWRISDLVLTMMMRANGMPACFKPPEPRDQRDTFP